MFSHKNAYGFLIFCSWFSRWFKRWLDSRRRRWWCDVDDVSALFANRHDWTRWPIFFGAIFWTHWARSESQVVVVFFDGWQVRWNFEFVGWSKASKRARWQFPHQTLLVWHFLLSVVVGKNLDDSGMSVEECAVWDLLTDEIREVNDCDLTSNK